MELVKIRLSDLEEFINSAAYAELNIKPVSSKRAISYISNPNAKSSDIVLYYISDNNNLIAFRTVFADVIYRKGNAERFGWLSGNWVAEKYRGQGIAKSIFNEIYNDWNCKLMFTNYSPEGLKSNINNFASIYTHNGARAYYSFSLRKRFGSKKVLIPLLFIADIFIYVISRLAKLFYSFRIAEEYSFNTIDYPDKECLSLAESQKRNFLFGRGKTELSWIFNYPWMTSNRKDNISTYPFSSYAKEFYYKTVKIYNDNKFSGFFTISVRNGNLKTLCFYSIEIEYSIILKWIKNYAAANNLSMITILDKELAAELKDNSFPFLYVKNFKTNIYSSFSSLKLTGLIIQDGDGDYIFT